MNAEPLTHVKLMEDMVYDRYLAHVTDRQAIRGIHIIHQKFVLAEAEGQKLDNEVEERRTVRVQRGEPEEEEPREVMMQRASEVINRIFHDFIPQLTNLENNKTVEFSEGRMFEDGVWTRYFQWFRRQPENRRALFQQLPKLRKSAAQIARKLDAKVRGIRESRAQENPGGAAEKVAPREEVMRTISKTVDLFFCVEICNKDDDDEVVFVRDRKKRTQKRPNRRK